MKLLPYKHFYITTDLAPEEILKRLEENIDEPPVFVMSVFHILNKLYQGYITGNDFTISRQNGYRKNILSPTIAGSVTRENNYSLVEIKIKPDIVGVALFCVWGCFASSIIISIENSIAIFVLILSILLPALLMIVVFNYEAKNSKQFLLKLFNGTERSL